MSLKKLAFLLLLSVLLFSSCRIYTVNTGLERIELEEEVSDLPPTRYAEIVSE